MIAELTVVMWTLGRTITPTLETKNYLFGTVEECVLARDALWRLDGFGGNWHNNLMSIVEIKKDCTPIIITGDKK